MPDRAVVTYHESNYWKDNQRWVVRDGPAPLHDPPGGCCEMCGCDECTLTWVPSSDLPPRFAGSPGEWLCERCEPRSQPMPDRAVVDGLKLNPACRCTGCDGSCEEYENLTTHRWEEPMSENKKIAEYGVPGDSFNVYATPEGHIVLELINTQTTRIAMTTHFAEMMANDLLTSVEQVDPREGRDA